MNMEEMENWREYWIKNKPSIWLVWHWKWVRKQDLWVLFFISKIFLLYCNCVVKMQFFNSWCLVPLESRGRVFTKAQSEKCKRRYKMSPSRDGDSWASPCLRALNVASVARASHCTVFAPELFSALDKNQLFSSRSENERAGTSLSFSQNEREEEAEARTKWQRGENGLTSPNRKSWLPSAKLMTFRFRRKAPKSSA
jgi:hypothetical protein